MSLKISTSNLSFTNNIQTVALYKCLDSPPVIVTYVIVTTQNMGTAQTASGCAVCHSRGVGRTGGSPSVNQNSH